MATSDSVTPNLYADTLAAAGYERQSISRAQFQRAMNACEVSADFITCFAGVFASYYLYLVLHIGRQLQYSAREVAAVGVVISLFAVLLLQRDGAYRGDGSLLQIRETERAIWIPAQALLFLLPFSFLLNLGFSRASFVIALFLMPILLVVQKRAFASIIEALSIKGHGVERVVIYGAGETGRRILSTLLGSPRLGLRPVAVIDDDPVQAGRLLWPMGYRRNHTVHVRMGPLSAAVLKSCQCDMLIVAVADLPGERLLSAAQAAAHAGIRIAFLPGLAAQTSVPTESIEIDGLLLTSLADHVEPWCYEMAKRAADFVISSILLFLFAPFLLIIAAAIKLNSPGPAIFVQKRAGLNGRIFNMFKFRSMYADVPRYDFSPTTSADHRITGIGKFLRRTSLDELPQLINVLRGDMSLVGPRPEMPFIVDQYNAHHRERLKIVPGITGLWQLSADRSSQIHQNLQYDLYYIRHRSFSMDVAILIHTLFFAMRGT
jgi:exopolysaccharide biosynthesis polyprenyl glycosylphosphotransferase